MAWPCQGGKGSGLPEEFLRSESTMPDGAEDRKSLVSVDFWGLVVGVYGMPHLAWFSRKLWDGGPACSSAHHEDYG